MIIGESIINNALTLLFGHWRRYNSIIGIRSNISHYYNINYVVFIVLFNSIYLNKTTFNIIYAYLLIFQEHSRLLHRLRTESNFTCVFIVKVTVMVLLLDKTVMLQLTKEYFHLFQ